jgi:trans-2,3-dihydro-3-hydroxyanthranilate isomerase
MKLNVISCFCTNDLSSGNPAAIIEEFDGNNEERKKLATKINYPVTVFIHYANQSPVFEFFYPAREMPLCLHGALAAGYILMKLYKTTSIQVVTKNQQELTISQKSNDLIFISVTRGKILGPSILFTDLDQMINVKSENLIDKNFPFCVASIGSPKLLIPLLSYDALASLQPNFDTIKQWSVDNHINGLYVYTKETRDQHFDYIARGFNPKGGNNEDAATGVAAGALYEALNAKKEIKISQGEFISRPSCLRIYSEKNKLFVGGKIHVLGADDINDIMKV